MLPLLAISPADVDVPMDFIPTYATVSDTSSESGGDTDSRSDNGHQGRGQQPFGGSATSNEHQHIPSITSPPLTITGQHSAWYAPYQL